MARIRVNSIDDIVVKSFDLHIRRGGDKPEIVNNGVVDILKGTLVIEGKNGDPLSRADIIGLTNLSAENAVLVPEFLNSDADKLSQDQNQSQGKKNQDLSDEEISQLKQKMKDLEALRKDLARQRKELAEKEKRLDSKEEEQEKEENAEGEAVEQIIQQLEQSIAAMTEAVNAAASTAAAPPPAEDSSSKKASNATSQSSGSTSAPAGEQVEEVEIFVEAALTSRSDSGDKGDFITKEPKPSFEIKTLEGATITLVVNGITYSAMADSNGNAIINFTEDLEDGEYVVTITAKDPVGGNASTNVQLVIDTVPPEGTLKLDTDSGTHEDDNLTNVKAPTFSGSLSGDPAEVILTVGTKSYIIPPKNGDFTYTLPELEDGKYDVTLTITDAAGNDFVIKQNLVIDTVNNFSIIIEKTSDAGKEGDWKTNDPSPTFRFEHEIGASIQIRYQGVPYDVIVADEPPTFYTLPFDFVEGLHPLEFISVDLAGNKITVEHTLDIDTTPPVFDFQGLTAATNTGDQSDLITQSNQPVFRGSAEAGATIVLILNNKTYKATADLETSLWEIPINELEDDTYTFQIYAEDAAGNKSEIVIDDLIIDSKGPLLVGGFAQTADTGSLNTDGRTNFEDLVFNVTTDPKISVSINIKELNLTVPLIEDADNPGQYTYVYSDIPEGDYTYIISATDQAGNPSQNNLTGTVYVDRSIDKFSAELSEESDSGRPEDNLTNEKDLTFNGEGEDGSKILVEVKLHESESVVISEYNAATVKDGIWELTLKDRLGEGFYDITFTIVDLAGNEDKRTITIEVDRSASIDAKMQESSDTGDSNTDLLTKNPTPSFEGSADPNSDITFVLSHSSGESYTLTATADNDGNWVIDDWLGQSLTAQGEWRWSVRAEDPAGNISETQTGKFTFDNIAPSATITLGSELGFGGKTNDDELDFIVNTEPNSKIMVTIYPMIAGAPGSSHSYQSSPPVLMETGEKVYTVPHLDDGTYFFEVTVTDPAGNSFTTTKQEITIDTKAPELGIVSLTAASDTNIVGDNITNKQELLFQGTGSEVGSRIYITIVDTKTNGPITLTPSYYEVTDSNWSYQLPITLEEGTYDISFVAEDAAGNRSEPSKTHVKIDTSLPNLGGVMLTDDTNSASKDDFITSNLNPVFKGSSDIGDKIYITIWDGANLITSGEGEVLEGSNGIWTINLNDQLGEGTYRWQVVAIDEAGNKSELKAEDQLITIDSFYDPDSTASLDISSNSGSTVDDKTKETSPLISGKGEANSSVKLISLTGPPDPNDPLQTPRPINVQNVPVESTGLDGNWSMTLPALGLGDGVYTFTIEYKDLAGNTLPVTNTIVLDTQNFVEGELASDTGISDSDWITNDDTPTFTGTSEVGATIELILYNTDDLNKTPIVVEPVIVNENGTWSITAPTLLEGDYVWSVKSTDLAGNEAFTENSSFRLDLSPPGVTEEKLLTKGVYDTDPPEIAEQEPVFSGTTSEKSGQIRLCIYPVTNGVAASDPWMSEPTFANDGKFTISPDPPLEPGTYLWSIVGFDTAGNKVETTKHTVIIDKTPPDLQPVGFAPDTDMKEMNGQFFTGDNTPSFTGKSEPTTRIKLEMIQLDSVPPNTSVAISPDYVIVDSQGNWTFTPDVALPEGTYSWTITAYDAAGNEADLSGSFTVDTIIPEVSFAGLTAATDSGSDAEDMLTKVDRPTFKGHVSEDATITIVLFDAENNKTYTIEQFVSAGDWEVTASEKLNEGSYTLQYFATDPAGNATEIVPVPPDPSINLVIDRTVEGGDVDSFGLHEDYDTAPDGDIEGKKDQLTNLKDLVLSGNVEPGTRVELISLTGPAGVGSIPVSGEDFFVYADEVTGDWVLALPSLLEERFKEGIYTYTLRYTDLAGNPKEVSKTFEIDTSINTTGEFDSNTGNNGDVIYTNNTETVSFSGTGAVGDKVTLVVTGPNGIKTYYATVAMVNGKLEWSIPNVQLGNDGTYSWTINAVDAAGNKIEEIADSFIKDTTKPGMPTLSIVRTTIHDQLAEGNNSNATHPTLKVVGEPGASVEFTLWMGSSPSGIVVHTKDGLELDENGQLIYNYDGPSLGPQGTFTWQVEITDYAGNTTISNPSTIVIDTTAPPLNSANLAASVTDPDDGTVYIKNPAFSFSGSAEEDARVYLQLSDKNGNPITVEPDFVRVDNGQWTYTLSETTANAIAQLQGTFNWSFYAVDAAGNVSDPISGSFYLDSILPEVSFDGLGMLSPTESTDTGTNSQDLITNNQTPIFTGTSTEDSTIRITLTSLDGQGGSYTFTKEVLANQAWSILADQTIAPGRYSVTITATDAAGNISEPALFNGQNITLEIDTAVSEGTDHGLHSSSDSAADNSNPEQTSDDKTNITRPSLGGVVEAGTVVSVGSLTGPPPANTSIPVGSIPTATSAADGSWSILLPELRAFGDGEFSYTINYVDVAGNTDSVSGSFVIDTSISVIAEFGSASGDEVNDNGIPLTNAENTALLQGTATLGDKITIRVTDPRNNLATYNVEVENVDGSWRCPDIALTHDGIYTWQISAVDTAGNELNPKLNGSFERDTTDPSLNSVAILESEDTGFVNNDGITNNTRPTFVIKGEVGAKAVITLVGPSGTISSEAIEITDSVNGLHYQFPNNLGQGNYTWTVVLTDAAGNTTTSLNQTLKIDTDVPILDRIEFPADYNQDTGKYYITDANLSFSGTTEPSIRVYFELIGPDGNPFLVLPEYADVDANGDWTYSLDQSSINAMIAAQGQYTWTLYAKDAAGNDSLPQGGSFILDTIKPTITFTALSNDSGEAGDLITNAQRPSFTGTSDEDATISITLVSTDLVPQQTFTFEGQATAGQTWAVMPAAGVTIPEGTYRVSIVATDPAGNRSETISPDSNLVIDRNVIGGDAEAIGLLPSSDSGTVGDDVTKSTQITLSGTVEDNTTVELTVLTAVDSEGNPISLNVDLSTIPKDEDGDGSWQIRLPDNLPEGIYTYTVNYTDQAGNTKPVTSHFTIDRSINVSAEFKSATSDPDSEIIYTNVEDGPIRLGGTGKEGDEVVLTLTGIKGYEQTFTIPVGADGTWNKDILLTVDDVYSWTVNATDAAGNAIEELSGSFIRDTAPPEFGVVGLHADSDWGFENDDGITGVENPTFSIEGEAGASIQLKVWKGTSATGTPLYQDLTLTIPPSGVLNHTFEGALFSEGDYVWEVTMTDLAGNVSVTEPMIKLEIDRDAPPLENIVLVTDSGHDQDLTTSSDWKTNVTSPTFSGESQEGARVYITILDKSTKPPTELVIEPEYVTAGAGGIWTYPLETVLGHGEYSVSFTATDLAGNPTVGDSMDLTIDTEPPELTNVRFHDDSDTGSNTSDRLTNDDEPTIQGTTEKGAIVVITLSKMVNGELVEWVVSEPKLVENNDGSWSITFDESSYPGALPLTDGDYQWSVVATDVAGNPSAPDVQNFKIDTTVENVTSKLSEEDDLGWNNTDGKTSRVDNLTLEGTAEENSTVKLVGIDKAAAPGFPAGSMPINPPYLTVPVTYNSDSQQHEWVLNLPTLNLGEGEYTYTLIITDLAGNEKEVTGKITIDLTDPDIEAEIENSKQDDLGNHVIKDGDFTVSGTTNERANIEITILNPALAAGQQQVRYVELTDKLGDWSTKIDPPLESGTYTWVVVVTDEAGNEARESGTIEVDKDEPDIDYFHLSDESITSADGAEQIASNKTSLEFNGKITGEKPNQPLTISLTVTRGDPAVNVYDQELKVYNNQEFDFSFPTTNEGLYSWTMLVTDLAGNQNDLSGTVLVDRSPPEITRLYLQAGSDTGSSQHDFYSNSRTPVFKGSTEAHAKVVITFTIVTEQGTQTFTAEDTADEEGNFTLNIPSLPVDGEYTWQVVATDAAGNTDDSLTGDYTLDTTFPVFSDVVLGSDTGRPDDEETLTDWKTNVKRPVISGKTDGEEDVTIRILEGTREIANSGPIKPNNGDFTYDYGRDLIEGTYTIEIKTTDKAGNETTYTKTLIIDTSVRNDMTLDNEKGTENLTCEETLTFSGTTDKDATVELRIYVGGSMIGGPYEAFVDANTGNWTHTIPTDFNLPVGVYHVTATVIDAAGNRNTTDPPYEVEIERTPPTLSHIQIMPEDNTGATDDWITENQTLRITGSMQYGTSLHAVIPGFPEPVPISVNPLNGSWVLTLTDIAYGTYEIDFVAVDEAGNEKIETHTLVVKSSYREFTAGIEETSDTGVQDDNVTQNRQPTLAGTITPGYSMSVTINGAPYEVLIDDFGDWTIDIGNDLADGTYTVVFTVYDNATPPRPVATPNYTFRVDNTASLEVELNSYSNSGAKDDFITNAQSIVVNVTVEAGSRIIVRNGVGEEIQSTTSPSPNWSFTLNNLGEGSHDYQIETIDPAGNVNFEDITIEVDRSAPLMKDLELGGEAWNYDEWTTRNKTHRIEGNIEKDDIESMVLRINGRDTALNWDAATGNFSFNLNLVNEGPNNVAIIVADAAGNQNTFATTIIVKTEIKFTYQIDNDNGLIKGDGIINDNKIDLSGTGYEGESVTLSLLDANGNAIAGFSPHEFDIDNEQAWSHTFTGLSDGTYKVRYSVTDEAGNSMGPTDITIVLDTKYENFTAGLLNVETEEEAQVTVGDSGTEQEQEKQEQALVQEQEQGGLLTGEEAQRVNTARPAFTGTGEPGSTIYMQLNGADAVVIATVQTNGTWTYTMNPALENEPYTVVIYAMDAAGNQSESETINIIVDTVIDDIDYVSDIINNDGYNITGIYTGEGGKLYVNTKTSENATTFQGKASEDGKIKITINGQQHNFDVRSGQQWSRALDPALPEGTHDYTIIFEDLAGNFVSDHGKIIVDKTIKVSFRFDDDYNTSYPGVVDNDRVTRSDRLGFEFEGTDSDVEYNVTITHPNGHVETLRDQKATQKLLLAFTTENGNYGFHFVFKDPAGNTYEHNTTITVDKLIQAIGPEDISFGEERFTDGVAIYTNQEYVSLTLNPTTSEYRYVKASVNGYAVKADKVGGAWVLPVLPMIKDTNEIIITAYDLAGNSTVTKVLVNYQGEIGKVTLNIEGQAVDDLDNIPTDYINLDDDTLTLSGSVSAGTTVTFSINGVFQSSLEVGENGSWSQDILLNESNNRIVIHFVDLAGNEKTINFTTVLDTRDPIIDIQDLLDSSGNEITDETVTDSQISITGSLDTGSSITSILLNGQSMDLSGILQDNRGDFTINISTLVEGENVIVINAVDLAGNTKEKVIEISKDSMVDKLIINDIPDPNEQFSSEEKPFFSGEVEQGSTVIITLVSEHGSEDYFPYVNGQGIWQMDISGLAEGNYSWSIKAIDEAGNEKIATESGGFVVDHNAALNAPSDALTDEDSGFSSSIVDTEDAYPTFSGHVEPDSSVLVSIINKDTGEHTDVNAIVDGDTWLASAPDLAEGEYSWQAVATDEAGNPTLLESGADFSHENSEHNGAVLLEDTDAVKTEKIEDVNLGQDILQSKVFSGQSEPESEITITLGEQVYQTKADQDGDWMQKANFETAGSYEYKIDYTDINGNPQSETGSVTIGKIDINADSQLQDEQQETAASYQDVSQSAPPPDTKPPDDYDYQDNYDNQY